MKGQEVFIPKLPSYDVISLAKSINQNKKIKFIELDQVKKFTKN